MKYRKKPVVIEATQWFRNGDHPEDEIAYVKIGSGERARWLEVEGKVVRYYRDPERDGQSPCEQCGRKMRNHGWIDTREGGHIVCPGDWIIKGVNGEFYPCRDDIFQKTYEPALAQVTRDIANNIHMLPPIINSVEGAGPPAAAVVAEILEEKLRRRR